MRPTTAAVALALIFSLPARARAQPWVPADGEGSVSVLYHHLFVQDHLFSRGERRDIGHIRTHVFTVDVEYGVTDRLAVRAAVPFVASKYTGAAPHRHPPEPPPVDDFGYNSAFQDLRLESRYGVREFPAALAPFVAISVPTHDYDFFGHSAVGLNLAELQVGMYAGLQGERRYVQARYGFGIFERVVSQRRTRSTIDVEFGWLPRSRLRFFTYGTGQFSHSGLTLQWPLPALSFDEWNHHDQLARAHALSVGGGASLRVGESLSLFCSFSNTLTGRNTHGTKYGVTIGSSWAFSARRARRHIS